jgi:hypothetical protein
MIQATTKQSNPKALDDLRRRLKSLGNKQVAIGYPSGTSESYPDGTSVIEVAASHVYGIGVPERDFFSDAAGEIQDQAKPLMQQIAKAITSGKVDPDVVEKMLDQAGSMGAAILKNAITSGSFEPLSDVPMSPALRAKVSASWGEEIPPGMSYRAAKKQFRGSDKPLVDTGLLTDAITHVVRDPA